ncbi:MAG: nucleotidyltransferase family protein [Acidimicrobiia bacterium]
MTVAAAVLAAGRGSRFSPRGHKLVASFRGRPLAEWAIDAAVGSGLAPVLIVIGRQGRRVARRVPDGVDVVRSRHWRRGIAHSLRAALDALEPDSSVAAVCVGLADQPLVGSGAYRRLVRAHADGAVLAVATYEGQRANPVLLDRTLWPAARALRDDVGARALMRDHPVTEVDCSDTGSPVDVDTLDDLRTIEDASAREGVTDRARATEGERDRDADH